MYKKTQFPEMMNTEQAARYIGIDTGTLRKWARNGDIPAHKVGPKLWRFFKSELAERMETVSYTHLFWSTDKAMKFIAGETENVCPLCSANTSNTAVTAETASV